MSEAVQFWPDPPTTGAEPLQAWMPRILQRVECALGALLPSVEVFPCALHEAMRYATLGGGKRLRALLCHAAGELVDADPRLLDGAASAIEMIHAYSLVHDDLPAMDNDLLRRGQPTVHVRYGEATAILVGDGLQAQAFVVIGELSGSAEQKLALLHELAHASSSLGMVGGQAIDLASVGLSLPREELERMHRMKTGALLRAAVLMGAHCGVSPIEPGLHHALDDYQRALGLAFQVVDDVLDVTTDAATLGKTPGKDAQDHKPTYVSLLGLDAARALAGQLGERARDALAPLGARAAHLHGLADMVVHRVY
ncbi:polyprenyl synthetase family protein [Dyella solisilvae]|uniref:Polyprenyl synthetase family protein n=1 Tax=Dyella solisilvae TaxID=1920168 RepID=A0A370K3U3_9GAMM|nr:farnesyl diphosphate synthase [Dyella solisilvae]RDI97343.1 polyprenyl synthetase family protein [Dyella solisilvae]